MRSSLILLAFFLVVEFESRLALFYYAGDCAASSPAFCFFQIQSLYKAMGRRPHAGSLPIFKSVFLIARPNHRPLMFLFYRIKVLHDSHMYGPGHPVLIFLILQALGFLSITQESAFHYDNRLLHMKQEIIVVIGLGHPLVGLAQHIVKALLQNFRQKLSLLRCLIVKDLASGYIFLMVTVLVNADHQIRCRLIYDFAPLDRKSVV